jgi:8-oxo-dGTP diphosphatase
MTFEHLECPHCGAPVRTYRNPIPTVDIIIEVSGGIVLIQRRNEPHGWALPGGFVDYGETLEAAAVREAREETALELEELALFSCYSDPGRDLRMHTISTVFVARGNGAMHGGDDAAQAALFDPEKLPDTVCFDHRNIIADYLNWRARQTVGGKKENDG